VSLADHSDAELMNAVGHGSMAALGEVVRRHQDRVLSVAYRMLGRWDLAEDVAQETFLRVHRAAKRYRPQAKFTTWLYRIVVNLCLDVKRQAKRAPVELTDAAVAAAGQPDNDPLEQRERVRLVRRAVANLPERQRLAVILHRYEGLSHREIAAVTGWSESAVESLLVRAYANLRKAFAELEEN